MEELDAIAAELCALPPSAFTGARAARAASDPALAKAIRQLRKPVVAAWAVNLLTADGQLGEVVALAAAMRDAQDELDAATLARLGRERRALVAALARQAGELAAAAGVALSAAVRDDVELTINAAVTDAGAGAAVLTGRLLRPLRAGGVDAVDLTGAVAGSAPVVVAPVPSDDLAERRARREAERRARAAERAAEDAARDLERITAQRGRARERAVQLAERVEQLRVELTRVEQDAALAQREADRLGTEWASASARAKAAARAVAPTPSR
jgi:hypothetical protein